MLISLWLVWVFAAQLPCGSGRQASTIPPEVMEGSGVGDDFAGLDLAGFYDDEDGDDDSDYDDHGHDGDEFYDDYLNFDDVLFKKHETSTKDPIVSLKKVKKIRCFRCLGDGTSGCDVNEMVKDLDKFTVTCVGKCLNISAGPISVFDCARDLSTKTSMCLNDFNTKMCFCDGNLCNGPLSLMDPSLLETDIPFPLPSAPSHNDNDVIDINRNIEDYDHENTTVLDNTSINFNNPHWKDQHDLIKNNSSTKTNVLLSSKTDETVINSKATNELPSGETITNNRTSNIIPAQTKNETRVKSSQSFNSDENAFSHGYFQEAEIDIIIPGRNRVEAVDGNNSSSDSPDGNDIFPPADVHSLSVASLQDGGRGHGDSLRYVFSLHVFVFGMYFVLIRWQSVL